MLIVPRGSDLEVEEYGQDHARFVHRSEFYCSMWRITLNYDNLLLVLKVCEHLSKDRVQATVDVPLLGSTLVYGNKHK